MSESKVIDISVIVPIYNAEKYLAECLSSVVNQSEKNIEVICVNDGSTDGSPEIIQEFAQKHKNIVVLNQHNSGYGAAVNNALDCATGEYIGIVESDDYIDIQMYEKLYTAAKSRGETKVDVIKSGFWEVFQDGRKEKRLGLRLGSGTTFKLSDHPELLRAHPSIWSCIYNKNFLDLKGIRMKEVPGGGWVDNLFFFQTLCESEKICWVNEPLYFYRSVNAGSSSDLRNPDIPLDRLEEIYDYLDERNFADDSFKYELYRRTFWYIRKIEKLEEFKEKHVNKIGTLVERMDPSIAERLPGDMSYVCKKYGFKSNVRYTPAVAGTMHKAMSYYRTNGFWATVGKSFKKLNKMFTAHTE